MVRVQVEQGVLEGFDSDGVAAFLGIPYAAPPQGDLRWAAPEPPAAWDGVRDATTFGAAAMQVGGASFDLRVETQSEDSLFINVWTTTCNPDARRPVMVWLHGGGDLGGAGSEDAFDGRHLAQHGVTVVTLNYGSARSDFSHIPLWERTSPFSIRWPRCAGSAPTFTPSVVTQGV
jgi:para-nitrobenzyl esterase